MTIASVSADTPATSLLWRRLNLLTKRPTSSGISSRRSHNAGSFIRITFKKDGTYTFETKTPTAEESNDGKWEVVEKTDNKVVIKSTDGDGEEQLVSLTFKDKDNLDALMPGEPPVTMSASRVKATATKEADGDEG